MNLEMQQFSCVVCGKEDYLQPILALGDVIVAFRIIKEYTWDIELWLIYRDEAICEGCLKEMAENEEGFRRDTDSN